MLALDCLRAAKVQDISVDLGDARIVRLLLEGTSADSATLTNIHAALAAKDASALADATQALPPAARDGLQALLGLYGGITVLDEAARVLPASAGMTAVLSQLRQLAGHLDGVRVTFDLADLRGYAYYSGARFAIYVPGASDALVRGGRYDEVGAVFGRNRPAAGFSMDVRELVGVVAPRPLRAAIRAPWSETPALRTAIAALRASGETVVCALPGAPNEVDEFLCDRELVNSAGQWTVQPI